MTTADAPIRGIRRLCTTGTRTVGAGVMVDAAAAAPMPAVAWAGADVSGRSCCTGGGGTTIFWVSSLTGGGGGVADLRVRLLAGFASTSESPGPASARAAAPSAAAPATAAPWPFDARPAPVAAVAWSASAGWLPPAAASYSATDANTGNPADAARARVAASDATIDSRRLLTTASRDSSRKFIREVAIRDPYGITRATFVASELRIRAAAEVISSSTSR